MTLLTPFLPQSIRYGSNAFPDVEPFSMRAAASFEDIQYSMVVWIRDQLTPYLAANIPQGVWDENAAALTAAVDQQLNAALASLAAGSIPVTDAGVAHFVTVAPQPLGNGQDDTANLNAAFAKPGLVIVCPGSYTVAGNLYVAGAARTHVAGFGAVLNYVSGAAPVLRVQNTAHVIEGLTLVGNGAADGSAGILTYPDGVVIRNNVITNMGRFGIFNSGGNNVVIANNKTDKTSQSTAMSDAPSVAAIINDNGNNVVVTHNTCTNTRWGITMRSDSSTQNIFGCLVEGNSISCDPAIAAVDPTCQGLSAGWTENLRTVNNTVYGYSSNCIDHHGSHHDVITGNTVSNGGADGIFVGDYDGTPAGTFGTTPSRITTGTVISGNAIKSVKTGIRVWDGAQFVTVTGNSIDSFTDHGIQVRGGPAADPQNIAVNNITVTGNMLNSENVATGVGIWVTDCSVALIGQNQINRPGTYGILVDNGSDMVRIENNAIQGAGYKNTAGQMDGVWTNCPRTFIRGNTFYGANGVAINIAGGQNSTVSGNRFRSITSGPITDNGTATTQSDNLTV